MQMALTQAK